MPGYTSSIRARRMREMPLDPIRYTRSIRARRLRGAAALMEMLAMIGAENTTDHDVAHIVTDNEPELREVLSFALTSLAREEEND